MAKFNTTQRPRARERLLDTAYGLFATQGVGRVGVDTIVAESGCAKSSLYHHFDSKEALALAFLQRREQRWTHDWLDAQIRKRAKDPEGRLLAVFDVFDGWFRQRDFEGCSFINVLLESDNASPVRKAAGEHLANIRALVRTLADEAGLADSEAFAQVWHMLMKGSIVAAGEGTVEAARLARRAARIVLDGWPRGAKTARATRRNTRPSARAQGARQPARPR